MSSIFEGRCPLCGGRVWNLMHAYTSNTLTVDWRLVADGYVVVNEVMGYWSIPREVVIKKKRKAGEGLYLPHSLVCGKEMKDV